MSTRIYVGNLPFEVTEKQIRDLVAGDSRTVTSVKMVTDKETKQFRGFAFVDLENGEQAQAAIGELNGKDFGGRALKVNQAEDRPGGSASGGFRGHSSLRENRDQGPRGGGFGSRGLGMGGSRGSQRGGGRGGGRGS